MGAGLRRIYDAHCYGDGPLAESYWETTVARPPRQPLPEGETRADVAIIGGGYTGLSAALHLARDHGADVVVLEAERVGWGASGRNGGFVSLGGVKASDRAVIRRHGPGALDEWHRAQRGMPDLVAALIERHGIAADVHSREGELCLAHRPRDFAALRAAAAALDRAYGVRCSLIGGADLAAAGFGGAGFHGGLLLPIGFALNPLKYVLGLAAAARGAGARIFEDAAVTAIGREGARHVLVTPRGRVVARRLILATNGYSSETVPPWMAGRYLPALSAILVTREMSEAEIAAQGWTATTMAYDTRRLLHYVRLMPNRRFLFGARGGLRGGAAALAGRRRRMRADFEAMFPAWAGIETPHFWSGFVCLTRPLAPYLGPLGDLPEAWAGFGWHGNGVALGTWSGRLLARLAAGARAEVPAVMARPPGRFPFGTWRAALLAPAYALYGWRDRG